MNTKNLAKRDRKKISIRKKLFGTPEKPRLAVFRSNKQIYAQLVDDTKGITIVSAYSGSKEVLEDVKNAKGKVAQSKFIGTLIAKLAIEKGVSTVIFDRSGYRYHGRVKAVAEGAREGGLKF
jgi:large subunit ribosomal protein L18